MIKWKILKQFFYICLCTVYDFALFGEMPTDFVSKIKLYPYKIEIFLRKDKPASYVREKEHIALMI